MKQLNEESFSRLMRNMQGKTTGLISAYRADKTTKENEKRQKALKEAVRSKDLGFNEINGYYQEEDQDSVKPERTLVIYTDNDKAWLKDFLLKMAQKFDQDSFIVVDKDNGAFLIGGTGADADLPPGEEMALGQFSPSKLGQAYSRMGKDTFVFEGLVPESLGQAYYYKLKKEKNIMEELLNEEFEEDCLGALAAYLEVDPSEIKEQDYDYYGLKSYEVNGEEWAVAKDYDQVEEACIEEVSGLIDELGYEALSWDNMGGIENYIDTGWFEDAMRESYEFYVQDIESESASDDKYETRLEEEMAEAGITSGESDDYVEYLVDSTMDGYKNNPVAWYIAEFGEDSFDELIKSGKVEFDKTKAGEEVLEVDGAGHILAGYDGEMIEQDFDGNTYYLFRN